MLYRTNQKINIHNSNSQDYPPAFNMETRIGNMMQQVAVLCDLEAQTKEELIAAFKAPFKIENEKHQKTREDFDWAVENIDMLLTVMVKDGLLSQTSKHLKMSSPVFTVNPLMPSQKNLDLLEQMCKDDPALFEDQKKFFREEMVHKKHIGMYFVLSPEEAISVLQEKGMDVAEMHKKWNKKKGELAASFWDEEILPLMHPEALYRYLLITENYASHDLPPKYDEMLKRRAEDFVAKKQ